MNIALEISLSDGLLASITDPANRFDAINATNLPASITDPPYVEPLLGLEFHVLDGYEEPRTMCERNALDIPRILQDRKG
jgi:hypothetical protein